MNSKKILILLFTLFVYVNYVMHYKQDISKLEQKIVHTQNRILKEEKLFKEKVAFKEMNSTKDYSYLFFDGTKSYSTVMGEFQQLITAVGKESNCTIVNTQWQDMPMNKQKAYNSLSLKLSLQCQPKQFIVFQNHLRVKNKLFLFDQLRVVKNRRKNFLNINTTLYAFRSRKDEK